MFPERVWPTKEAKRLFAQELEVEEARVREAQEQDRGKIDRIID
jgi:hypothetical protein